MTAMTLDESLIDRANEAARKLDHDYIGSEHLLAAILADNDSPCVGVLKQMGADPEAILMDIAKLVQCGPPMTVLGRRPQTPRARMALEYAKAEAIRFGSEAINDLHVMAGLLNDNMGVAFQSLCNTGIDLLEFKNRIDAAARGQ